MRKRLSVIIVLIALAGLIAIALLELVLARKQTSREAYGNNIQELVMAERNSHVQVDAATNTLPAGEKKK